MAEYKMITKNGYNFYDMASLLQKAIRRGEFNYAGFAAKELAGSYRKYLWKRLLIISAEDCYGIVTKEIVALKIADDMCSNNNGEKGDIFICKAIVLLCMCLKNRDACYFGCNFFREDVLDPKEIPFENFDINECKLKENKIPDWVFDVHTLTGKIRGKTINDMIVDEQKALSPKQEGMFDNASWDNFLKNPVEKKSKPKKEDIGVEIKQLENQQMSMFD